MTSQELLNEQPAPWATVQFLNPSGTWPGQTDNFVRTTRYTWWSFIPLTLLENFRIATNIYFLIVLVMCCLPWSPIWYGFSLLPLLFVLAVSMAKSGIEDLMKYNQDKKSNSSPVKIYKYGEWVSATFKDVRAGDMIMHEGESMVACDMLFITSSNESQMVNYSETQLNGESAVKTMVVHPAFKGKSFPSHLHEITYEVQLPEPNRDLFRFDAKLIAGDETTYAIASHNVLLRGMCVHYTDWVIGVALCTGHDTKVMKNTRHPPAKRTQFDRDVNKLVISVFLGKMILVLIFAGFGALYETDDSFPYLNEVVKNLGESFGIAFMQYFVLYSYLIPISMMVTVEIVRLYHMFLIMWDRLLVDEEFGEPIPHNSNTIGQLGVVTHILSDKTGTLTENVMELVAFVDDTGKQQSDGFLRSGKERMEQSKEFLLALAICNTVIVFVDANGKIEYNAESPDEAAFVSFAAKCGIVLVDRQPESFALEVDGTRHEYTVVSVLPFDSDRKRMSIAIQEQGTDDIVVYTKGADNIMYDNRVVEIKYCDEVNEYAVSGLRTLVFAKRILTKSESASWLHEWHEASSAISERDAAIARIAPQIESNLEILGVSAVEDKLQKDVESTIKWLRAANIAFWVLTGDKLETAIEIGKTSAVIGKDSDMMIVSQNDDQEIADQLKHYEDHFDEMREPVLILTGRSTELVLGKLSDVFLSVALRCKSVIFSRVSPFQKASIVALVKSREGTMTLAIGDGANDVGMLQEAHVGIGVKGHEGSQAAQTADFAVPRFRNLVHMLGIHGHWAMNRMSHVALFMLYKNFTMIVVYLWSSVDTLVSPTAFYDEFLLSCYNLVFTIFPPFAYGFFERDQTKKDLMKYPQLYNTASNPMKLPKMVMFFGLGLWQSIVVYYVVRLGCPIDPFESNGNLAYICVVIIVAVQFMVWSHDWNWWIVITCVVQVVLVFGITIIYAYWMVPGLIGVVSVTLGSPRGWMVILMTAIAGNVPYIAINFFVDMLHPTLAQLVREHEGDDKTDCLDFVELMKANPVFESDMTQCQHRNSDGDIELEDIHHEEDDD